jgi:hypothetical protein
MRGGTVTRKALLAGAVILTLAGCSSSKTTATGTGSGSGSGTTGAGTAAAGGTSSTSGGNGGAPGDYKACDLLTKSAATAILGGPTDDGKDETAFGTPYPACVYTVASTTSSFASVGLTIFNTPTSADGLVASYKSQYTGLTPLPGLGDTALQESDGRLVVAVKNHVGCAILRAGDVIGSADASTKALSAVCAAVFAKS